MINLAKREQTIVYENEFVFNEVEFFKNLIAKDNLNPSLLDDMQLTNENLRFVYQKDNEGSWYKFNYKGDKRINWDNVPHWMREHVWSFEKEHNMFFR